MGGALSRLPRPRGIHSLWDERAKRGLAGSVSVQARCRSCLEPTPWKTPLGGHGASREKKQSENSESPRYPSTLPKVVWLSPEMGKGCANELASYDHLYDSLKQRQPYNFLGRFETKAATEVFFYVLPFLDRRRLGNSLCTFLASLGECTALQVRPIPFLLL